MSISVIIIRVDVYPEMDIETSVYNVHLTRLIAREDFIKYSLIWLLVPYDPFGIEDQDEH
jgi:hypothetical protein